MSSAPSSPSGQVTPQQATSYAAESGAVTDTATGVTPRLPDDPRYARFIVDLFGVMAYGELSGFERLSSDARFSPTLHDRATLGRLAVIEFEHFEMVSAHLAALGVDVETAMTPFQPSIDSFHERTRPGDWYESLMKAYVIDAISDDFYTALAGRLDAPTRELIGRIQSADEQGPLLQERLQAALANDPRLASRLALWGRRLVGEALTQAQRIGIERAFLGALLFAGAEEDQEKETLLLFSQLTRNHSRRMSVLGLTA
ncbi:ferritin-like fold-containing protein [Arthrobacter sp. CAN_C5]|uniref:ferritin-like fold-containing protein n=1 Tax=Arthrobacter sp. CAN_C5 TaxID=2760706 RepID=UPI001AEB84EC|nr:ferritin-like fold-containing protein [Arthrobacter sp. CAN_C5]MBP2215865.1 hypothetical protein [Arthrobacter sp. CAN_C5]